MKIISRLALLSALSLSLLSFFACDKPAGNKEEKTVNVDENAKKEANLDADKGEKKKVEAKITRGTGPIAKIDGKEISRTEFDKQLTRTEERFQNAGRDISSSLEKRLKENVLRKLIDDALVQGAAEKNKVVVDEKIIEERFVKQKTRFPSPEQFAKFLKRTGQSEADIKADLKKNLVREELFKKLAALKDPTIVEAQKYFDENKDRYKEREQVQASHILFKVSKQSTQIEKDAKMKTAKEILARAKKGDDFAKLAQEFSEGPTKSRGGDLGKFSRGRMVKDFEAAAFSAKVNEIVGPIETQFGYHIIKVTAKSPARMRPFSEVKESIITTMKSREKSKATREILSKLRTETKIEILETGVNKDLFAPAKSALKGVPGGPQGKLTPEQMKMLQERIKASTAGGKRPTTNPTK